jgi:hypothetical protein
MRIEKAWRRARGRRVSGERFRYGISDGAAQQKRLCREQRADADTGIIRSD